MPQDDGKDCLIDPNATETAFQVTNHSKHISLKPLFRNIFLVFGLVAIVVMLLSFNIDYRQIASRLPQIMLYLPLIVGVWVVVYAFNSGAFQIIVNSGNHAKHLSFLHAYKLTVSGFAFSYTTPFGFGGGPYRVMELSAHIGTNNAMSSVVLYSMMHIFSHICLWTTAALLFICVYFDKMNPFFWSMFGIFALVVAVLAYFFYRGYKRGMIVKLYRILLYVPLLKRYARKFWEKNHQNMEQIDVNISTLHSRPRAFYTALAYEYLARVSNSFEFFFILKAFGAPVTVIDSILVLAFSSLLGNLLFFFPMQMGAREGGLAIIVRILGYPGGPGLGIFAGFLTRVRELVWIFIGVSLVKVGNKKIMK